MDEKLAKVSVVIVNYNAASLILNLIESFGSMIEDFLSVTVVDNCSKDNSVSELKNYLNEKNTISPKILEHMDGIGIRLTLNPSS